MTFFKVNLPNIDKNTFQKCIILFFVLSFLIYGKSISNEYAMDDEFVILNNSQVHKGIKGVPEIFRTTYVVDGTKANYEYRPIVKATYAIEYQLFGESPHISHFLNILLYVFSVSFLFFMMLKLLPNYHYAFSLLVAIVFLIHPLHSEVVLSIKNRDVLLSFLACLFALYYYLKYTEKSKIQYLFLGAFLMLIALLSKKDSMTFYAIIPITVWFFRTATKKQYIYIFASYLIPLLLFKLAQKNVINDITRNVLEWENPLYNGSTFIERIPTGFYSVYFYIKMYFIPYPLLSYYGYNQIPIPGWSNAIVWLMVIVIGLVLFFFIKNIKQKRIEWYGVIYFFVAISMFTNVVRPVVGIVGERFAYIPSLGLCILSIWALFKFFKVPYDKVQAKITSFKSGLLLTVICIIAVYGGVSFSRNTAWKNQYTLYETDVKKAPESAHLHTLFAAASIQKVKMDTKMPLNEKRIHIANALQHYKESIRIIPNYITSLNNLGMVYYSFYSKPEESIPYLKKAILLDTNYVEAYFNLATCEAATKQYDLAEKYYLKSIAIDSNFISTYSSLSALYAKEKQYDKILKLNQNAIDRGMRSDVYYINIGNVHFMQGDTLKALPYLEKGIEINPNNRYLNSFLADFYKRKGNLNRANHYFDLMGRSKK